MIFFDTETCGFYGPICLLQYAIDDGPIVLHNALSEPVCDTLELMEMITYHEGGIVGFNLSFDWFHMCQMYTTLLLMSDKNCYPIDNIEEYAMLEPKATMGPCMKPAKALDLMLHARKGPYQSTMDREDITLKRIPTALAWQVANELNKRIVFKDIYFARQKDKSIRWQVVDITDEFGDMDPNFKNIVIRFAPSSALKALAVDALGVKADAITLFTDVDIDPRYHPEEIGYAPYALAVVKASCMEKGIPFDQTKIPTDWYGAWPERINVYNSHWGYNRYARQYASDDVKYTRDLYTFFGKPEAGDDDSELACMVAAVRWRGFPINAEAITGLKAKAGAVIADVKTRVSYNTPAKVKEYIQQSMTEVEKVVIQGSTKAQVLEEIAKWKVSEVCSECRGDGCHKCDDGFVTTDAKHPAAIRASDILDARHATKQIELYDKLLLANRFHASFNVIGTLSSRMSGADGLNAQGINRTKDVRKCFTLADSGYVLCGGDYDGFEVVLADAAYDDPVLRADLETLRPCKCGGKKATCDDCHGTGNAKTKIHGLLGMELFPGMSYEDIMATKGLPGDQDKYTRSKNGVFAMLYGGESYTLQSRVGVTAEAADAAYAGFVRKYQAWGAARRRIFDMFCSMRQPGGIGSKVEWHDPCEYIESMFGFKRFFTLENKICKTLFEMAEDPPKEWLAVKVKVVRRDREQTATGAVRSALFAASFAIQAANMRAAANHVIQSSGATITKGLERRVWDVQPVGISAWRVQPFNVHDEVLAPVLPEYTAQVKKIVDDYNESLRPRVHLISMTWNTGLKSWADK